MDAERQFGAPPVVPGAPTANVSTAANNQNVNSSYDRAGNLQAFGSVALTYDAENRQTTAGRTAMCTMAQASA